MPLPLEVKQAVGLLQGFKGYNYIKEAATERCVTKIVVLQKVVLIKVVFLISHYRRIGP